MKTGKKQPENRPRPEAPAESAPARPRRLGWLAAPALAALTVLAYFPALRGLFLFDDRTLPMLNPTLSDTFSSLLVRGARAATNMSLLADRKLWDLNPFPYHVENLLLHLLNALLVFFIVRKMVEKVRPEGARPAAWFAAAVFLLHPLQTEAVSYIASRSEVLCVFFSYATWLAFLSRRGLDWGRALAVLALLGLGVVSKEPAVAMVAVLALTDYYFHPGFSFKGVFENWRLYGPLVAGAGLAGLRFYEIGSREGSAGASLGVTPVDYFLTQMKAIWIYLRLLLVPAGQNLDHSFPMQKAPGDWLSWLGLAALVGLVAAAWLWRKAYPLASLGTFTFLLLLAPTSSLLPIADPLVERRMYLPMIGLLLVASEALARLEMRRWMYWGFAAFCVLLTFLTVQRNFVYSAPETMWEDSVRANPANFRARFQLGFAYYEMGRCTEASQQYAEAARLRPTDYTLLVDWALALECSGQVEEAAARLKDATKLELNAHAWAVLGMVYGKHNRNNEALEALAQALTIDSHHVMGRIYRGNVLLNMKRPADAITDFDFALEGEPDNEQAIQGKALAQQALAGK